MKLYCMCQITGDVPSQARDTQGFGPADNQVFGAPNRFLPMFDKEEDVDVHGEPVRPVYIRVPMKVSLVGVPQKVLESNRTLNNIWLKTKDETQKEREVMKRSHKHYPNIDILTCPVCGARICLEG